MVVLGERGMYPTLLSTNSCCVCASYVTTVYKINVNRDNVCPSRVCLPVQRNLRFMWGLLRPS